MEKHMFNFLDLMNPNMYVLETKFGTIPRYNREGTYVISEEKRTQIWLLCSFFSCKYDDGLSVYDKWLSTKPIYVRMKNSTTDLLVPIL